jgi:hypothetical protein
MGWTSRVKSTSAAAASEQTEINSHARTMSYYSIAGQ